LVKRFGDTSSDQVHTPINISTSGKRDFIGYAGRLARDVRLKMLPKIAQGGARKSKSEETQRIPLHPETQLGEESKNQVGAEDRMERIHRASTSNS